MLPANRQLLESYRSIYIDRCAPGGGWAHDVLRIIREEWDPNYNVFMYCDSCKMKMVDYAFQHMDAEPKDNVNVNFEYGNDSDGRA